MVTEDSPAAVAPKGLDPHRRMLLGLMAFFFLVWFILPLVVPRSARGVYLVTLPFRHLGVFVHEMGHGLFTLLSGGKFFWFQMAFMEGGVAVTAGGIRAATLLGGLLGPALLGAILLQASTRAKDPRKVFWLLQALFAAGVYYMLKPLFLSPAVYPDLQQWSPVFLISLLVPVGGLCVTHYMRRLSDRWQRFYLQLLGILMCYSAYSDTAYIFKYQPLENGLFSDARVFAATFWPGGPEGVPFLVFAVVAAGISIINFALLGWGVWRAIKSGTRRPA